VLVSISFSWLALFRFVSLRFRLALLCPLIGPTESDEGTEHDIVARDHRLLTDNQRRGIYSLFNSPPF
jgi:hypothetical protein